MLKYLRHSHERSELIIRRLTSPISAELWSPECLARTLSLLSSMDMVRHTMISWSPRTFLMTCCEGSR